MAGEKCQVCGGKVVNGRCSLCGMPYRNDEALYHLNETREEHYGHASSKVREKMRGYAELNRQKTEKPVTDMNRPTGGSQNKKTPGEKKKSGISVWIIWLIIVLIGVLPQVLDVLKDWIGSNL